MERETKELKIDGHVFLVKTYATAREARLIQQAYFKGTKVEVVGEQPHIAEFDPAVQFAVQDEMVKQLVVSVDGEANVADVCEQLPSTTYETLIAQLDELIGKKKK